MFQKRRLIALIVLTGLVSFIISGASPDTQMSTAQIRNAQIQLSIWGYYEGETDGILGTETQSALRAFQTRNGLPADGALNTLTAQKLGVIPTDQPDPSLGTDALLLAQVVEKVAADQPYRAKVGIAATYLNRMKSPAYPNTLSEVIEDLGVFHEINRLVPSAETLQAAGDALAGVDPTGGCTSFYDPANSPESAPLPGTILTVLGRYRFYK